MTEKEAYEVLDWPHAGKGNDGDEWLAFRCPTQGCESAGAVAAVRKCRLLAPLRQPHPKQPNKRRQSISPRKPSQRRKLPKARTLKTNSRLPKSSLRNWRVSSSSAVSVPMMTATFC